MLEVSILTLSAIFHLEFGTVPTVWYALVFILLIQPDDSIAKDYAIYWCMSIDTTVCGEKPGIY